MAPAFIDLDPRQDQRRTWTDEFRYLRSTSRRSTPDDKERLLVCKYDSILVSQLHIPANSNGIDDHCYAYVTIILTHEEDRSTTHYLRKGLDFMIRTYETAVEESINLQQLATNPCVTPSARDDLYDRMMHATVEARTYIQYARARVQELQRQRGPHHQQFDSLHVPTASPTDQHAP